MKNKFKLIHVACLLALLSGCGSGTSSSSANTSQSPGPVGPVSYQGIYDKFNPAGKSNQKNSLSKSLQDFSSDCGHVMSDAGNGIGFASGFINFIPDVGPILGLIVGEGDHVLNLFGGKGGNSCVAQEFQSIENQLFVQQQEINQIEANLNLSSNNIWNSIATNASNIASDEYTAFSSNLDVINGNSGALEYIYSAAGFYDSDSESLTSQTLTQLINNTTNLSAVSSAYSKLAANNLSNTMLQISGAKYGSPCPENESGYRVCYKSVIADPNSILLNLLENTHAYLQTELTSTFNNGGNLVPLLDDYNNTIMSYYQQSLSAIQNAYHLAYLANYLNFQTGSGSSSGMSDIFAIPGTYYESGTSMGAEANATATQMYNEAQLNLTLMTAALINQLYTNVVGYIVTDVPVGVQSYPNTQQIPYYSPKNNQLNYAESINYSSLIGKLLPSGSNTASQNLNSAISNLSTQYQSLTTNLKALSGYNSSTNAAPNLFFYQYSGLNNVASCIGSLESYNQQYGISGNIQDAFSSSSSCPALFTDINGDAVNQSVFSNTTIQPYYTPSANLPALTGSVTNNINTLACNGNSVGNLSAWHMYYYTPNSNYPSLGVKGTPYLMCGNWQTTGITNSIAGTNNNPGIIVNTPGNPYMYASMLATTLDVNHGTNVYFNGQTTVTGQDSSTLWATVNGSSGSLTNGSVYPGIMSGWINENWPSSSVETGNDQLLHTIALQEVLPDGFIAPYAISMGNLNNGSIYGTIGNNSYSGNGFNIGVAPNPNVIAANVTLNGQPLYNMSGFSTNNMPYSSSSQIVNYSWTPVTSTNPIFASASQVSALEINGYLLSIVGNPVIGSAQLTSCFTNPNNTSVNSISTLYISHNNSNFPIPALVSFGMTNCYDVYYPITPNTFLGSVLYNAALYAVGTSTLISPSGINELVVQTDGNLVLYSNGIATWASNTAGSGSNNYLAMQNDGNLVLYNSAGKSLWSSGTMVGSNATSGYYLSIQDDGNLVMYNQADQAVWATGTSNR